MYSQHKGLLCIKLGCREKIDHTRSMTWCAKHLEERDRRKVDILPLADANKEIYGKVAEE
jgi:hypothetical protein